MVSMDRVGNVNNALFLVTKILQVCLFLLSFVLCYLLFLLSFVLCHLSIYLLFLLSFEQGSRRVNHIRHAKTSNRMYSKAPTMWVVIIRIQNNRYVIATSLVTVNRVLVHLGIT
jgi:hypothetical protein